MTPKRRREAEEPNGGPTGLEDPAEAARTAGLAYVSDEAPGITRRRRGKGFSYYDPSGSPIRDPAARDRLDGLAIPPAWTDVWICPDPDGHLQATGRDDRGRKQYRYHPDWRAIRDEMKYARMVAFAFALPGIRRRIEDDLKRRGLPREKVLAVVVRLLETSLIRIGNAEYARNNDSFGLTTMRDKHVDFGGATIRFTFRGKGGKRRSVDVRDRRLARIVKRCRDVPGFELFQYLDEEGTRQAIDSSDVNDYLRDISGEDFTAKEFRTWAGTLHASLALLECGPCEGEREGKSRVAEAVKQVAERLGNTPAICRQCYIHPGVIETYMEGTLEERLAPPRGQRKTNGLSKEEAALLSLLERAIDQS